MPSEVSCKGTCVDFELIVPDILGQRAVRFTLQERLLPPVCTAPWRRRDMLRGGKVNLL